MAARTSKYDREQRAEWRDYLGEMATAIKAGYMDDILFSMRDALEARMRVVDPQFAPSRKSEPLNEPAEQLVTRAVNLYQLVGKVVRINDRSNPRWARGLLVRVVKVNRVTVNVVWVSDPLKVSTSRLAHVKQFSLPITLLDVVLNT